MPIRISSGPTAWNVRPHRPNQEPYRNKQAIVRIGRIGGQTVRFLMNPDLTSRGNVSTRVSFIWNGQWYYRDDQDLRERVLNAAENDSNLHFTVA